MNNSFKVFLIAILPVFILLCALVYILVPEPEYQSEVELYAFTKQFLQGTEASASYADLISMNPKSSQYQYAFAKAWVASNKKERTFLKADLEEVNRFPPDVYKQNLQSSDSELRDAGYFGLAAFSLLNDLDITAKNYIDSIANPHHPGVQLLLGIINERQQDYGAACSFYKQEMLNNGLISEASKNAVVCSFPSESILEGKVGSRELEELPNYYIRYIHFINGNVLDYVKSMHKSIQERFNPFGMLAAFLITLGFGYYFYKLSRLVKFPGKVGEIALIGGVLSSYPILIAYDFSHWGLGVTLEGGSLHKFWVCIVQIGLIEELGKLLPVLLMMVFLNKRLVSPFNLLLFATLSGLGFTFVEDSFYFSERGLDIITSRTMIAGVLHMAWSSIAIYGYVLWRFKDGERKSLHLPIAYFLLAVLLHGVYDFWLLNEYAYMTWFMSIVITLFSVIIWVKIINNSLNNSGAYENRSLLNIRGLNVLLICLLCGVIFMEYLLNALVFGSARSTTVLVDGIQSGFYFIPALSFYLSRLSLAPGGWSAISLELQPVAHDLEQILQQRFELKPYRNFGAIAKILPLEGVIRSRIKMKNDNNWFLFLPDKHHLKRFKTIAALLIKPRNKNAELTDKNLMVHVRLVKDIELAESGKGTSKDFKFVDWGTMNQLADS